ncbi:amino acid adenylation domain-containing protein [Xenorhabdus bovienii]|uniref:non-ribosomal peptide synthetase n=1 Tax=Xenorhabdus bovienii TaxID=40576 RepID=UPI0023B29770|nr:amino acid adenylation domain-containing protein [Xenorhabdus bovienii]MDE9554723.1 amino acid adenylation domain-containing protein [Xenorhabdus bovienii]
MTSTELKMALRNLVADISGIEKNDIAGDIPLFQLGLDPITLQQVQEAIERQFNLDLGHDYLAQVRPTLEEVAHTVGNLINTEQANKPQPEPVADTSVNPHPANNNLPNNSLPLSSVQRRLYTLCQRDGGDLVYHITQTYLIEGALDIDRLERGFQQLIARHDSLRTGFTVDGEQISQTVKAHVDAHIVRRKLPENGDIQALFHTLIQPFDLAEPPLIKLYLVELGHERHVMVWDIHHIVLDGLSGNIIFQELMQLYRGESLAPVRAQYRDYLSHEQAYLQSKLFTADETFWQQQFLASPPSLDLPLDKPRGKIQVLPGSHIYFDLSPSETAALHALARINGTSLFMVLLAAYYTLLHRLTHQEDMVIGIPSSGRTKENISDVVGMCVNTLAIRMAPQRSQTFSDFLAELKKHLFLCLDHQNYPFERLVEQNNVARNLYRSPIFDTIFAFENATDREFSLADLKFTELYLKTDVTMCDLTLETIAFEREIKCVLHYCTAFFNQETAERYAEYYQNILKAVVANPAIPLAEIDYLPATEQKTLLQNWGRGPALPASQQCFHELFEEQVARAPDNIALVLDGDQLTYEQLNAKANRVAHYLRQRGIKPDTLVGLCLERSFDMIIGLLGIIKAGGAYVPIDPAYPRERIATLLAESGITLLLSQQHLYSKLPVTHQEIIFLDSDSNSLGQQGLLSGQPTDNIAKQAISLHANHLAYVIYTSGSTGKPKGVMIEHKGWVNLAKSQAMLFSVTPYSRGLQFASLSFDATAFELSMILAQGATLYLITESQQRSPEQLDSLVEKHQLTHVTLPPVLLPHLTIEKWRSVTTLLVAGEAISPNTAMAWAQGRQLINAYGPTETTVCATAGQLSHGKITIGKPLGNTLIRILDSGGRLVPVGVVGELCVGGTQLARGYLNDSAITARQFVAHALATDDLVTEAVNDVAARRLYRTGDLARWLPDGNIEFIGRIDSQVKVRGHRIELGEIETQLTRHPDIKDAIVIVRQEASGDKRLIAYFVAREGRHPPLEALLTHLEAALPHYMLPSALVMMERFPLTPNGKVDYHALPEADSQSRVHQSYEPPQGEIETFLAELWQELLEVEQVGRNDNFFQLGGHSILATQVIVRIRATLSIDVLTSVFFNSQTLAELAAQVTEIRKEQLINKLGDNSNRVAELLNVLASMPEGKVQDLLQQLKTEGKS